MGDITRLFSAEELNRLSTQQKGELSDELAQQLAAAPEIKDIIDNQTGTAAHEAANQTLFQKMAPVLQRLGLQRP